MGCTRGSPTTLTRRCWLFLQTASTHCAAGGCKILGLGRAPSKRILQPQGPAKAGMMYCQPRGGQPPSVKKGQGSKVSSLPGWPPPIQLNQEHPKSWEPGRERNILPGSIQSPQKRASPSSTDNNSFPGLGVGPGDPTLALLLRPCAFRMEQGTTVQ